jgi:hypothetical protein
MLTSTAASCLSRQPNLQQARRGNVLLDQDPRRGSPSSSHLMTGVPTTPVMPFKIPILQGRAIPKKTQTPSAACQLIIPITLSFLAARELNLIRLRPQGRKEVRPTERTRTAPHASIVPSSIQSNRIGRTTLATKTSPPRGRQECSRSKNPLEASKKAASGDTASVAGLRP